MAECRNREIEQDARSMFNDICLVSDTEVMRLVGLHEDACDYYYRVRDLRGKEVCHSAVCPCVSLKGMYPRYEHLENIFSLNGCPPAPEFIFDKSDYESNKKMYGKKTADEWVEHGCP